MPTLPWLGLTLLAGEFVWAKRCLRRLRVTTRRARRRARDWNASRRQRRDAKE